VPDGGKRFLRRHSPKYSYGIRLVRSFQKRPQETPDQRHFTLDGERETNSDGKDGPDL